MKFRDGMALAASTVFATVLTTGPSWAAPASLESSGILSIITGFAGSLFGTSAGSGPHLGSPVRVAPGPEMSAGLVGMMLVAGVIYLIMRRNRRHNAVSAG
jgi:nitrate reductase gamma subunit